MVGYISNNNLFPEPLTAEEEKIYLEKLANGDEKARNILIEKKEKECKDVTNVPSLNTLKENSSIEETIQNNKSILFLTYQLQQLHISVLCFTLSFSSAFLPSLKDSAYAKYPVIRRTR